METVAYTFDEDCFSDLHKDAYGFRPNSAFFEWIENATDAEKQAEWDSLIEIMGRRMDEDAEMEREAIVRFEANVATVIASGAKDRATAIKWMMDAENVHGDSEFFEYLNGIPYGYTKQGA